jgi:hypothetical protein
MEESARTWRDGSCPDCGKIPEDNRDGTLRCGCKDKRWNCVAGIEGTTADSALLKANGFHLTSDIRGDKYYLGSMDRLLWLYPDGSWSASPRPKKGMTFEEYVRATTLEELLGIKGLR